MNNKEKNESLLELATRIMEAKKKPKSLKDLTNEIFQARSITENIDEKKAQFQIDFMLSGLFVCCGEDKNGNKLWDLKSRQSVTLLDKDGNLLEDIYDDDEDVIKNELKDDYVFGDDIDQNIDELADDKDSDDDDNDDKDDIEEELIMNVDFDDDSENEGPTEIIVDKDDEEEDEEK